MLSFDSIFSDDDKTFIAVTSMCSFLISLLYFWKGLMEGFSIGAWIIIGANLLYIPLALIFKRKVFSVFFLFYAVALVFITAFHKTFLYNNYSSLFIVIIVIMVRPAFKLPAIITYLVTISAAFAINDEHLYHYFIHITRTVWFFYMFNHVLGGKYHRRKLILNDDEIKILTELSKKRLQKSIEFDGYSESTIYRRLKAAMTRNKLSKAELLEEFKKEFLDNQNNETNAE